MTLPAPKFAAILVSSIFLLGSASLAHAQVTMIVSPPRYDLSVKPGEVIQKTVKVTNGSETAPLRLRALVSDFVVYDDEGTPTQVTTQASGRFLASPWFSLSETEFTLDPRAQKMLTVIIAVPDDALPGGHYAGVFFEPVVKLDKSASAAYTSAEVGALFGLTVEGDLNYSALIKDFRAQASLYEFGPVDFLATIENQSDTHITPQSSITIRNMIGQEVATLKLDEPNIFPFASRNLNGSWDRVWGLGRYTATLTVSYGPGLSEMHSLYFWIMPYRLLAAILVVILVLLTAYILIRRHLLNRQDTRNQEIDELKRRIVELENHKD